MPFPSLPLGSVLPAAPQGGADPGVMDLISQLFAGQQDQSQDELGSLLGTLEGALGDVQSQPGPTLGDVPGRTAPLARGAATFAGLLAEQLGARGASAITQGRMAQHDAEARRAEEQNLVLQEQDRRQRMKDILELRGQMSDAKIAALKEGNNMAELEKELKARYQIDSALQKQRHEDKTAEEEQKIQGRMELEGLRASERRKTSSFRAALEVRTGTSPRAKALLAQADEQAGAIRRTSEGMRTQNERSITSTTPFSEQEVRMQENRERLEIDRIYMRALDALEGKTPLPKADPPRPEGAGLGKFFKQ